mgnify:CR=1 FL=1
MSISSIHVGCGDFSLQRLDLLITGNEFEPVACVDISKEKAKSKLLSLKSAKNLANEVYTSIRLALMISEHHVHQNWYLANQ